MAAIIMKHNSSHHQPGEVLRDALQLSHERIEEMIRESVARQPLAGGVERAGWSRIPVKGGRCAAVSSGDQMVGWTSSFLFRGQLAVDR